MKRRAPPVIVGLSLGMGCRRGSKCWSWHGGWNICAATPFLPLVAYFAPRKFPHLSVFSPLLFGLPLSLWSSFFSMYSLFSVDPWRLSCNSQNPDSGPVCLVFSRTVFCSWKQKTPKTRLVERVIFVFLVSRVLKMTLFREQQNLVFPVFLLFTEQN